jgi:hypothetical protein
MIEGIVKMYDDNESIRISIIYCSEDTCFEGCINLCIISMAVNDINLVNTVKVYSIDFTIK